MANTISPINKPRVLLLAQALESGRFQQGRRVLFDQASDTFCCLGVACVIANEVDGIPLPWKVHERFNSMLNVPVRDWYGFEHSDPYIGRDGDSDLISAITVNDVYRDTFPEIAKRFRDWYDLGTA